MDTKDSFTTVVYRSGYIHTCQNRTTGREEVELTMPDGERREAKSVRGAKAIISRHIGHPIAR